MGKKWVTIFERYEDFHFKKDVGQIPYHANVILNYEVELWHLGKYNSLTDLNSFKIRCIKDGNTIFSLNLPIIFRLVKEAKKIDVLTLFHFRKYSLIYASIFKFLNPTGFVMIKCDANNYEMPFLNQSKIFERVIKFFAKKIDLLLIEHLSILSFFNQYAFKTFYMPNGVSAELYNYAGSTLVCKSRSVAEIIFVGKCGDPRKNAELIIRTLADLPHGLKWRARFYGGQTKEFDNFIEIYRKKPFDFINKIEFMGFISDAQILAKAYAESHIFLMTSHSEGYPLSMIEACWLGCMPILSDRSGGDDLVACSDGYIYKNEASLLSILLKSIQEIESTIDKGKRCQKYVSQNNDWRINIKKLGDIINNE
ncbi:glycosyltransferase family 4 protein [Sodalis sp. RH15]|uniref:glycosyltransferase family 4 protein n=1 Tax=Sodalis sp. RH15 TaxID=3394330 RepID=UPI0039B642C7